MNGPSLTFASEQLEPDGIVTPDSRTFSTAAAVIPVQRQQCLVARRTHGVDGS